MRQITIKFRKYIYLIVTIVLLFSDIQIFAQEADFFAPLSMGDVMPYSQNFITQIDDLYWQFNSNFGISDRGRRWIKNSPTWYEQLIAEEDRILFYTRALDVADKDAIEIITYTKYLSGDISESLRIVRLQDQFVLKKLKEIIELTINEEYLNTELPYSELIGPQKTNEFKNCILYFKKRFASENFYNPLKANTIRYNSTIYTTKMVPFFKNAVDPIDILKYTYLEILPQKQKAGVKLLFEAMDPQIIKNELTTKIMKYLTDFGEGITDVQFYNLTYIRNMLKGKNVAERTKYVEEITNLQQGSKNFIHDVGKLKPTANRYVRSNITQGFWTLGIICAIITTTSITDVIAENHYNNATRSQRDLANIGKKIENGLASKQEQWIFFTNPISKQFVETDPIYTVNFASLTLDIYQTQNLLNEIKIEEAKQQKDLENSIIDTYQKTSIRLDKDPKLGIF